MFTVETEQESDGRWIAAIRLTPGALAYGVTRVAAEACAGSRGWRGLAVRRAPADG